MAAAWEKRKLNELAHMCLGKMLDQKKNKGKFLPYLANLNVRWGAIDLDNLREMRFEEREFDRYGLKYGDIVMCEGGEPGRCAIWKNHTSSMMIQKALHRIRAKEGIDSFFLYYALFNIGMNGHYAGFFTGAAIKHLTGESLAKIEVDVPPLPIQEKIAAILSAYDDLIENNLKRIKLLEEMAQISYEEWFVHRKIYGELIADYRIQYVQLKDLIADYKNGGWGSEVTGSKFSEIAYVIRGTDIPDILSGNFNSIPKRYHTSSNLKPRILIKGDIIMEMSNGNMGNVGRSLYFDEGIQSVLDAPVMCASFCKMVRAKCIGYSYIIDAHIRYIHKNNQMLVYKSQGANGINNFHFENMIEEEIINIPIDTKAQEKLFSIFEEIYKAQSVLRRQIHSLKEARDILLPRLMTGIIDVESYNPADLVKEVA